MGGIIVLCGIDGSGKTTLFNRLKMKYKNFENVHFLSTYGSEFYSKELECVAQRLGSSRRNVFSKEIRCITWVLDLIHERNTVQHKFSKDDFIFYDRYFYSSLVFGYYYECLNLEDIKILLSVVPPPDIVLFLKVSPEVAMERIISRGKNQTPYEYQKELEILAGCYEKVFKEIANVFRIEANYPLETVYCETEKVVETIIKK